MSYNIDTWTTKKLDGLTLPLAVVHALPDAEVRLKPNGTVLVVGPCEGFEMTGRIDGDRLRVDGLEHWGSSSGWSWDALKTALEQSTGELVATQVWEGGDQITRLTVKDGAVGEEIVEI